MKPAGRDFVVLVLVGAAWLGGCQTTDNMVPTAQALSLQSGNADLTNLERGRTVLLRSCAECHTLQPIRKYSVNRWHEIVAVMAPRARLSAADRAALEAYLVVARRSFPE
jgi:hypothetical protein